MTTSMLYFALMASISPLLVEAKFSTVRDDALHTVAVAEEDERASKSFLEAAANDGTVDPPRSVRQLAGMFGGQDDGSKQAKPAKLARIGGTPTNSVAGLKARLKIDPSRMVLGPSAGSRPANSAKAAAGSTSAGSKLTTRPQRPPGQTSAVSKLAEVLAAGQTSAVSKRASSARPRPVNLPPPPPPPVDVAPFTGVYENLNFGQERKNTWDSTESQKSMFAGSGKELCDEQCDGSCTTQDCEEHKIACILQTDNIQTLFSEAVMAYNPVTQKFGAYYIGADHRDMNTKGVKGIDVYPIDSAALTGSATKNRDRKSVV